MGISVFLGLYSILIGGFIGGEVQSLRQQARDTLLRSASSGRLAEAWREELSLGLLEVLGQYKGNPEVWSLCWAVGKSLKT